MGKRGVSAVIAMVLIILISVVAATILWIAVMSLVRNIDVSGVDARVYVMTSEGYTVCDSNTNVILIQVKRGVSDANISKIRIILDFGGNSESMVRDAPEPNGVKTYNFSVGSFGRCPDYVSVAPILIVGNKDKEKDVTSKEKVPVGDIIDTPENPPDFGSDCEGSETQPCGTDVGECTIGVWTCNYGEWGACSGIPSSPEVCFGGLDEDCDNKIDGLDEDCGAVPPNYISWWKFEDGVDAVSFADEAGLNDGNCSGATCPTFLGLSGIDGSGAYQFDGVGNYIEFGTSDFNITETQNFSVSVWVNIISNAPAFSYDFLFGRGQYSYPFRVELSSSNVLKAGIRTGLGSNYNSQGPIIIGNWYHIVQTYSNRTGPGIASLYINGVLNITNSSFPGDLDIRSGEILSLGGVSEDWYSNAIYDNFMIYNSELNLTDVQQLYCNQGGSAGFCP